MKKTFTKLYKRVITGLFVIMISLGAFTGLTALLAKPGNAAQLNVGQTASLYTAYNMMKVTEGLSDPNKPLFNLAGGINGDVVTALQTALNATQSNIKSPNAST